MIKVLTKREKIILSATVGVIIFVLGFNFLIAPVLEKNTSLNKEIKITRLKLKKYLLLLSQKERIQTKFAEPSSTFGVLSQEAEPTTIILSELQNMAKEADIRIIDIRPQTKDKKILIDLRTEGAMEGYLKFIYTLENSLLLLKVEKFQLNAKPHTQNLEGVFSISQTSISE